MCPQPTNVQGKALKDRIDCSMQIGSQLTKMSVTVSHNQLEELVQSFNGRDGPVWDLADTD